MPHSTEWEEPQIVLNDDMRPTLVGHLDKYHRRLKQYEEKAQRSLHLSPELLFDIIDTKLKIAILTPLLHDGVVRALELAQTLASDPYYSDEQFMQAYNVIHARNAGEEERLRFGTGLPESQE